MSDLIPAPRAPARDEALAADIARLGERIDRLAAAVEAMERRREELDEFAADLMPALNGMVSGAVRALDELEREGVLAVVREGALAARETARSLDPAVLRALGQSAPDGVRTLRAALEPEVAAVAEKAVAGIRAARTGRPPSLRALIRALREPHVRRGLGAGLAVLRAMGEGGAASAPRAPAAPARAASRPAAAAHSAPGCQTAPAAPAPAAATVQICGRAVAVDAAGFLVDRDDWTPQLAEALAQEAGIPALTERHWAVIEFCRRDAAADGAAPGLRRITQAMPMEARELYALFPGGPGILAARIAGLPKPKSCV